LHKINTEPDENILTENEINSAIAVLEKAKKEKQRNTSSDTK
jgi:hypothetical protein